MKVIKESIATMPNVFLNGLKHSIFKDNNNDDDDDEEKVNTKLDPRGQHTSQIRPISKLRRRVSNKEIRTTNL